MKLSDETNNDVDSDNDDDAWQNVVITFVYL